MRVGILTGGGDCPGLNAVLRAFVVHGAVHHGFAVTGFRYGWRGLVEDSSCPLAPADVADLIHVGGTFLGTSRTNPYKDPRDVARLRAHWARHGLDALVAIGGEDTLGVAQRLSEEGYSVVGCPKTIDNDLPATDYTFGFDTAVNVATECIDRVRTTAASHHRAMVIEVMGRHAGWIAAHVGIATGAHVTLLPELEVDLERTCEIVRRRDAGREGYSLVVVAEGIALPDGSLSLADEGTDAFGHVRLGGVGDRLAALIERRTGVQTRAVRLGYVQRGGAPCAFDRVLSTRFGYAAADLVARGEFGRMVALRGTRVVAVPLTEGLAALKTVDRELYELMRAMEI